MRCKSRCSRIRLLQHYETKKELKEIYDGLSGEDRAKVDIAVGKNDGAQQDVPGETTVVAGLSIGSAVVVNGRRGKVLDKFVKELSDGVDASVAMLKVVWEGADATQDGAVDIVEVKLARDCKGDLVKGDIYLPQKIYQKGWGAAAEPALYDGGEVGAAVLANAWGDVARLVEIKADVNSTDGGTGFGYTPLMVLASKPRDNAGCPREAALMVKYLIDNGAASRVDNNDKTALHVVGKYGGHPDQVQVLIDGKADLNACQGDGMTPLGYVLEYKVEGYEKMEEMLAKEGAKAKPE